MLCKNEFEREARIILQLMIKKKHVIKKLPFEQMALYRQSTQQLVFVKKLPAAIVKNMANHKWLKLFDLIYNYTEVGQKWLAEFIYFINLEENSHTDNMAEGEGENLKLASLPRRRSQTVLESGGDYSPIYKLYNRQRNIRHKYLNETHLQAGQQLFDKFVNANLQPNITMNWEKLASAPQPHYTGVKDTGLGESLYLARKQLYEALEYVGEDFAAILVEVCLFGNGLEATEKALAWPARSGKLLLTMALDRLAQYYKIDVKQKPKSMYLAWAAHDVNSSVGLK
ncbi:MAG: DUF6456 domain-containing protein [Hyphomicrobiales bacterium]